MTELADEFYSFSLYCAAIGMLLFTASIYSGLIETGGVGALKKWKAFGLKEIGTEAVLLRMLGGLMVLFAWTQAAYMFFPSSSHKDAFEVLTFLAPAAGTVAIGYGLLKEHPVNTNLMAIAAVRYYLISLFALLLGFIGLLFSHPISSVLISVCLVGAVMLVPVSWIRASNATLFDDMSGYLRIFGLVAFLTCLATLVCGFVASP